MPSIAIYQGQIREDNKQRNAASSICDESSSHTAVFFKNGFFFFTGSVIKTVKTGYLLHFKSKLLSFS